MDRNTSLVKSLDLLTLLGASQSGYTVQTLADAMNQPRSTIVRVLNTLVEYGLVKKEGRTYQCTETFQIWANKDRHSLFRLRYRKVLEHLSSVTGELVLLGVQDGVGIVHIDYIESDQAVRVAPAPTTRHNIRRNAIGKLCIAQRPDLRDKWLREEPGFASEIGKILESGIAWNREESVSGMIAMAVYGFSRNPTEPKVAVAWPVHRFSVTAERLAIAAVRECFADSFAGQANVP